MGHTFVVCKTSLKLIGKDSFGKENIRPTFFKFFFFYIKRDTDEISSRSLYHVQKKTGVSQKTFLSLIFIQKNLSKANMYMLVWFCYIGVRLQGKK